MSGSSETRRCLHFAPGTGIKAAHRPPIAIVAVDGDHLLVTDGKGNSGWLRPMALSRFTDERSGLNDFTLISGEGVQ